MCLHPPNVLMRVIHTSGSAFSKGVEIAAGSRCLANAFNSCCVNTSSFYSFPAKKRKEKLNMDPELSLRLTQFRKKQFLFVFV